MHTCRNKADRTGGRTRRKKEAKKREKKKHLPGFVSGPSPYVFFFLFFFFECRFGWD